MQGAISFYGAGDPSSSSSGAGTSNVNDTNINLDLLKVLDHVKINDIHEGPMSAIRGILKDSHDKDLSFSNRELKEVEEQLKVVLAEFYRKLRLLKNYRYQPIFPTSLSLDVYFVLWIPHYFFCNYCFWFSSP